MKFPNEKKNTTYVHVVTMTKRKKIPVATKKKEKDYCDYYSCSVLVVFFYTGLFQFYSFRIFSYTFFFVVVCREISVHFLQCVIHV